MGVSKPQSQGKAASWPIAVALVLSALFAIAIILKAKSEIDSHNAKIFESPRNSAKLIAANYDASTIALRSQIAAMAANSIQLAAANVQSNKTIAINAIFSKDGALISSSSIDEKTNSAMAAAAQLATNDGWIGPLSIGGKGFVPAMAIRGPDNSVLAMILNADFTKGIRNNQQVIVTDNTGNIIYSSEALNLNGAKNISQALGIRSENLQSGSGTFAKSMSGDALIIGSSDSMTGFDFLVTESQANANNETIQILLFYGLLFLGPLLAFFGVYFLAKDQENKFSRTKYELRETERRMRIAIEGARCGVWDWDLTDDTVFLTQRLANGLGFPEADRYNGEDVLSNLVEEDRLKLRAALRASAHLGMIDIIVRVRPETIRQGTYTENVSHLHLRGRAAVQKQSSTQIRLMGVSIDVSDTLQREQKALESEKRIKEIATSIVGPFALWNRDGTLNVWNDEFGIYFELNKTALHVGAKYDSVSRQSANAIKGVRDVSTELGCKEISLKNGKWLKFYERKTNDGGVISIGFEISAQKSLEQAAINTEFELKKAIAALNEAEEETATLAKNYEMAKSRAEAASKSKDVFLANMSHELRTPLNAIIGFSEMMSREIFGPLGDQRYLGYIHDIHDSGNHLLELINGVLDMAKIEAGKFRINPQNMGLDETIEQAIRITRGKADEKSIKIETDLDHDDEIFADARAIRQIMINLLSNSFKFTDPKGRVLVRTKKSGDFVTISVIDNGIGIDEKDIPNLAKPFAQVDSEHSRNNQGTGLGLALCQSFTALHGGRMEISSRLGVGTKIDIVLPIRTINYDEAA